MAKPARPTDAKLEILTVLWSRGPSPVREVHGTITRRRPARYTTILKLLQIKDEKGLVRHDQKQRSHIYVPAQSREVRERQLAGDLLQRAVNGSPQSLMLGARGWRKTSREDLAGLRRLHDEYEKAQ
jgi:predicted transcriptional regulator